MFWRRYNRVVAEPLKNLYGAEIPRRIGRMIAAVHPAFPEKAFVRDALAGYDALGLMARGRHIAQALHRHLPHPFARATDVLVRSLEPVPTRPSTGMASFVYLPHVLFVAEHGLDDFEASMRAQHELTQRFTAEFSIRAFLERHPEATLARLRDWASDRSEHVRRLVSEGTRPRLPWARRLLAFQRDPGPVLELLELLKDDPSLYVRRSVANNLNDIGKNHPEVLFATARRWLRDAGPERRWIVGHALRSSVKRGEAGALEVLGYGARARVDLARISISPRRARIGQSVAIAFDVVNAGRSRQEVLVDFRVFFVKANGRSAPKTFKLKRLALAPGEAARVSRRVSLAYLTTRRHYPGAHRVEAVVNGRALPLGEFRLSA